MPVLVRVRVTAVPAFIVMMLVVLVVPMAVVVLRRLVAVLVQVTFADM